MADYEYNAVSVDHLRSIPLVFCDGMLGDPSKENVIVVGGRSIGEGEGLDLIDGEYQTIIETFPETFFSCGGQDGVGGELTASIGGSTDVGFYILNFLDHIQGFSVTAIKDWIIKWEPGIR